MEEQLSRKGQSTNSGPFGDLPCDVEGSGTTHWCRCQLAGWVCLFLPWKQPGSRWEGSRWQSDSGVGVGREEGLGGHWDEGPRRPPKWPEERPEQVWAAWTGLTPLPTQVLAGLPVDLSYKGKTKGLGAS